MTYLKLSLLSFSLAALILGCSESSNDQDPLIPEIQTLEVQQADNNYSLYSIGHTLKLYALITYSDYSTSTTIVEVDWHPELGKSTTLLAHNGDITALKNSGDYNVTISYRDKLHSKEPKLVTIIPLKSISNITANDHNATNKVIDLNVTTGNSVQLQANGLFNDDKLISNISSNIVWNSSNPSIATVDLTGQMYIIQAGIVEVNASVYGDINKSVDLNITIH